MSGVSSRLFRAHMLLLRWGTERLGQEAAEGGQLVDQTPSAAADRNDASNAVSCLQDSTAGAAGKRRPSYEKDCSQKLGER